MNKCDGCRAESNELTWYTECLGLMALHHEKLCLKCLKKEADLLKAESSIKLVKKYK